MPKSKSDIFRRMSMNLKKNTKPEPLKNLLWGVIGGFLYPVIPTAIQGFLKVDMSGWKGVLTGGLTTTAIGMLSDKMMIAYGGIAAMTTHIVYVKANDTIASVMNTPIFAFDKTSSLMDEALPPGMEYINLPDGTRVIAQKSPALNDFVNEIPALQDYTSTIETTKIASDALNDFVNEISASPSLNDFDFETAVSNGFYD